MEQGTISKKDLKKLLGSMSDSHTVYGPVKEKNGTALRELQGDEEISLDFANFKTSLKGMFFPQCEVIGSYDTDTLRDVPLPEDSYVIFGMRPCDAKALNHLDSVFCDGDYLDPYYLEKREKTVIITLACKEPAPTCFCTTFDSGPVSTDGADIIVFDCGGALLFEACTEKGKTFLDKYSKAFKKPEKAELAEKDNQVSNTPEKVSAIEINGLQDKLSDGYESPLWEIISQRCLGCGICTYLCPTCHCFAIFEEKAGSARERIRIWDSCQYPSFTHEASGHNPRGSHSDRMRQRVMHKFDYFVKNFEAMACVGCGRCVLSCPVNLDIREILTIFASEK